jgi:hypothetical protein
MKSAIIDDENQTLTMMEKTIQPVDSLPKFLEVS